MELTRIADARNAVFSASGVLNAGATSYFLTSSFQVEKHLMLARRSWGSQMHPVARNVESGVSRFPTGGSRHEVTELKLQKQWRPGSVYLYVPPSTGLAFCAGSA
jgi:hypothetical protein